MSILCATDFSPPSRTAVRLAAALARRQAEALVLIHAIEGAAFQVPGAPGIADQWQSGVVNAAEGEMARIAGELRAGGLHVEGRVVLGDAAAVVLDAVGPDTSLMVMGTHGRRGAARILLGSCAAAVVRGSRKPVLVTPALEDGTITRWEGADPIPLALVSDGTVPIAPESFWIRNQARGFAGETSVVRIYWPPTEAERYGIEETWLGDEGHPELQKLIERDVRHEAQALDGARPLKVVLRTVGRDAGQSIAAAAARSGAAALVLGVSPHRRRSATGPATVLAASPVPVFCVPAANAVEERRIPQIRSLLIASDLSDTARRAALQAYGLLRGGGRAVMCHVVERGTEDALEAPVPEALTDQARARIEAQLRNEVPAEAAEMAIVTQLVVVEGRSAADAILHAAERFDVDAIALGSHGRTGLRRAVMGSVAEAVARKSTRPVFIAHGMGPR